MSNERSKVTIATHSGKFHADDVFAVATLFLLLEKTHDITVVRTRDMEIIQKADYVVDVGDVYDPEKNRFDHHQRGGAGVRENAIPYASFGLVWKRYGIDVSDSEEIARCIDEKMVMPIDAGDNGFDLYKTLVKDVKPYAIDTIVKAFRTTWREDISGLDANFMYLVDFAKRLMQREIKKVKDVIEGSSIVQQIYDTSQDKKILILDKEYGYSLLRVNMDDACVSIAPDGVSSCWSILALPVEEGSFQSKISFPESWTGKRDAELEKITGVAGAVFCHKGGFFAVAKTKESAVELAHLALKEAGK